MPALAAHVLWAALFRLPQSGPTAVSACLYRADRSMLRVGALTAVDRRSFSGKRSSIHACAASWERSSLCASACCLPAVTGNAGVVVGLSAIPLVVARASRAAAGAAVALAATPPTKAPWRPPWRLLLDPCQPLSRRADCITKECLTTEADHLLPLGFPRYLDKSRSLRERPTLGAAPWTSLASARTSWSACASVA